MKLTEKIVATLALDSGQDDRIWFDDAVAGFGLRIRRVKKWSGVYSNKPPSKTWLMQYRIGGKTRRLVIGEASAMKAGRAREIAEELRAKIKLGHDPAMEKRVRIERSSHTFGGLVEKYLRAQRVELRPGSYRLTARYLETHAGPLHGLPVDVIDQLAIAERLNSVAAGSGAVTANRVRSSISAMFAWAMGEGLALANPVANTNKRQEQPRDRVLTNAELRTVWRALDGSEYGVIIRLLILTGQRRNEIAALRWPEIDFSRDVISLPGERTKNGKPHDIPMSSTVRSLLTARPKNGRDFVFGEGAGPFSGMSQRKAMLDAKIAASNNGYDMAPWVHHDLRRSVATGMAEIGIAPHIIEAILNHTSGHKGGIAGIYNRAQYGPEKAQALVRWDKHIRSIVSGA
jgi:integrase